MDRNAASAPRPHAPDAALDALEALHTRTLDTLAGFEKMVEKAEPEFRPVAERFRSLHEAHAKALMTMLLAQGRTPDADGSLMASVNRAVISTRAFLDEIDDDVMDRVRSGEQHVLGAFDEALGAGLPERERAQVAEMRAELAALLDETRHID